MMQNAVLNLGTTNPLQKPVLMASSKPLTTLSLTPAMAGMRHQGDRFESLQSATLPLEAPHFEGGVNLKSPFAKLGLLFMLFLAACGSPVSASVPATPTNTRPAITVTAPPPTYTPTAVPPTQTPSGSNGGTPIPATATPSPEATEETGGTSTPAPVTLRITAEGRIAGGQVTIIVGGRSITNAEDAVLYNAETGEVITALGAPVQDDGRQATWQFDAETLGDVRSVYVGASPDSAAPLSIEGKKSSEAGQTTDHTNPFELVQL